MNIPKHTSIDKWPYSNTNALINHDYSINVSILIINTTSYKKTYKYSLTNVDIAMCKDVCTKNEKCV